MRIFYTLAAVAILLTALACTTNNTNNTDKAKEQEELYNQVMSVHDEVMPKMGELNAMARDLKGLTELPDSTKINVSAVVTNLDNAHEGMMAWMGGFQTLDKIKMEGKSHEEILAYLNEELVKVEAVKTNMLSSMTEGKSLLEQLKATK